MTNSSSSSSSSSTTSIIEPQDKPMVMKFVIRILFGREFKDHLKVIVNKVKFAVISVLPSLTNSEIISFIELGLIK